MKLRLSVLIAVAGLVMAACGPPRPAYKDINTNQQAAPANPDSSAPVDQLPPSNANTPSPTVGQASPAASAQPPAFKAPPFMDMAKGYPKDMPNYPAAAILNVQYGPQETTDVFSAALQTGDAMDKISAFYDKVVKSNGWTVANRVVDPEYSEWMLKKAADDEAKVTIQKDKQSSRMIIIVARTSKQPQPAPPKPQP